MEMESQGEPEALGSKTTNGESSTSLTENFASLQIHPESAVGTRKSQRRSSVNAKKPKVTSGPSAGSRERWFDSEIMRLVIAVQKYGMSNTKKIAEFVRTRDETAVKYFLSAGLNRERKEFLLKNKGEAWSTPTIEDLEKWPVPRKWKKFIYNEIKTCAKKNDYSKTVMAELFRTFYEEEEEPEDPQIINCKAIYKFFMECAQGRVPGQLSPLESAVVLMIMEHLDNIRNQYDFAEEMEFIRNFKKAKTFVPFQVKQEFKKRSIERTAASQSAVPTTNGLEASEAAIASTSNAAENGARSNLIDHNDDVIKLCDEIYTKFSKHRKLVECMNPLNIPMAFLVKEQKIIQQEIARVPNQFSADGGMEQESMSEDEGNV